MRLDHHTALARSSERDNIHSSKNRVARCDAGPAHSTAMRNRAKGCSTDHASSAEPPFCGGVAEKVCAEQKTATLLCPVGMGRGRDCLGMG
ncbi:hypothetical protein [Olivibacter sitiensis]|uniref:hypothetical protein n=1 Tax=Olivibacter sitiensis TaxID=376470 RepID=UPI0012FCB595|nr:hypothetical protein [Olivibacter sitiensis]